MSINLESFCSKECRKRNHVKCISIYPDCGNSECPEEQMYDTLYKCPECKKEVFFGDDFYDYMDHYQIYKKD